MFNRLAAVRIKAAEDAQNAGRLEEALDIVSSPDLVDHRRARQIRTELGRRFFERGQDRLLNKHFQDATADFEQAGRCGAPAAAVEEWRRRARTAMQEDQRAGGLKQAALAEARQRLTAGSLVGAKDALARSPVQDADGAALADEIRRQGERAAEAVEAAAVAFKQGHVASTVEHLRRARTYHSKTEGLAELELKVVDHVLRQCREAFQDGRLDRAEQELAVLGDLGRSSPDRIETEEALRLAREAARAVSDNRYAKAGVLLGRLAQIGIRAEWVSDLRKRLDGLESQQRVLLEGPLGMLLNLHGLSGLEAMSESPEKTLPGAAPLAIAPPVIARRMAHGAQPPSAVARPMSAKRLILRIDGVGSFLLLRGDRISIGRSGPNSSADLDLISDLSERHAEIVRAGEDYFLVSMSGVELAGRAVENALLQDGDRIRLGSRVKLKFLKPSLKSPAAALDLADGVRTTSDCRRVILWSGPLLLGNTKECHVPIRSSASTAVLLERDGRATLRPMGIGGSPVNIELGSPIEYGELRLSLSEATRGSGVGRVIG